MHGMINIICRKRRIKDVWFTKIHFST